MPQYVKIQDKRKKDELGRSLELIQVMLMIHCTQKKQIVNHRFRVQNKLKMETILKKELQAEKEG